jgi:transcriptional regulator with XRE-family HTH domain
MTNLLDFMNDRRRALGLTAAELGERIGLKTATVHKYLSGARPLSPERAQLFRDSLCDSPELRSQFDSLYRKSRTGRNRSPLDLAIDSPRASLRVATLDFQPFAGNPSCFVDRFVQKCLEFAVIRLEPAEPEHKLPDGKSRFAIIERVQAVERRRVDLLFNLISLERMKKLFFIPVPVRIAGNGVLFLPQLAVRGKEAFDRLHAARRLLVHGKQDESSPFCVVTIRNEIGHVFLEQTHHLRETQHPDRKDELNEECLDPQWTLDAEFLARRLRELGEVVPVMLASDERTALGVLSALNGDGVLVLPPNSDQAVLHSVERHIPPAYYFGIGMRRVNNWPLIDYLQQAFSTFLAVEGEGIAAWYEDLYNDLVKLATGWLASSGIYVGGIRLTTHRVNDPAPSELDVAAWKSQRKTLVEQTARAFARRLLTLSRRSLESLPPEMQAWRPILIRTRERIQVSNGGDRGRIRNIILYCAKMALGQDPLSGEPDPIGLLRQLVPAFAKRPLNSPFPADPKVLQTDSNRSWVREDDLKSHWDDFLYLMELELDMDLSSLRRCKERWFSSSSDLGRLISRLQILFEASRDSRLVLTIRQYNANVDKDAFLRLRDDYANTEKAPALRDQIKIDLHRGEQTTMYLIAYHLGEPVGFLAAEIFPPQVATPATLPGALLSPSLPPESLADTICVRHLHVVQRMHHAGVSRRLIRRIVEEGNDTLRRSVWLECGQWSHVKQKKFCRAGFAPVPGDLLSYEFKLACGNSEKTAHPWYLHPRYRSSPVR